MGSRVGSVGSMEPIFLMVLHGTPLYDGPPWNPSFWWSSMGPLFLMVLHGTPLSGGPLWNPSFWWSFMEPLFLMSFMEPLFLVVLHGTPLSDGPSWNPSFWWLNIVITIQFSTLVVLCLRTKQYAIQFLPESIRMISEDPNLGEWLPHPQSH